MSWIRSNGPTAISGQDNPEQGRRDLGGGDAQDSGQPRVERVAADGVAGAADVLRRLLLVEAVQERRAEEAAQGAGTVPPDRHQGGDRQED